MSLEPTARNLLILEQGRIRESNIDIPPPPLGIPLTEISSGYNMSGKTIIFTRPDLLLPLMDEAQMICALLTEVELNIIFMSGANPPFVTDAVIDSDIGGTIYLNSSWRQSQFDVPIAEENEFTIISNDLLTKAQIDAQYGGDNWGFDLAYVVDAL